MYFFIVEVEDGYTVLECQDQTDPAVAAASFGGTIVDAGPFDSLEAANDAIDELEEDVHLRDA